MAGGDDIQISRSVTINLPNSEEFLLEGPDGDYLIQMSWPLHWREKSPPGQRSLPVIYIVDGNALFLTATECAWRRSASSHFSGGGIVVAVGYPLPHGKLYDAKRRSNDLTPPTTPSLPGYGGADDFLDFIEHTVRAAVRMRFPETAISREALYGHSYGGLFSLFALLSRPRSFDCFMASSPSIWWNHGCIFDEARRFLQSEQLVGDERPSLMMFWGSLEQDPPQWDGEPLDHWEARKQVAADLKMADNARHMCHMLRGGGKLRTLSHAEYDHEEHTSTMTCSISRSLTSFFEDWPFLEQQA
ncbi:putative siderophore esterase [Elsinoe ampelina]|uniref:Putative siderophore esterase n=1 Tax=Elsinoe ampelina TaxID=302913 RepID=A0A6A6G4Z4_9PEZI|nr:putative siderophore esterase [Elsinoe ampelina]